MSHLEVQVATARLDRGTFVAMALLAERFANAGEVQHSAIASSPEAAVKDLQARLVRGQRLLQRDPVPLRIERAEVLQFRIDWPRAQAALMPVRIDVVQGFDTAAQQWVCVAPLLQAIAHADEKRELRQAIAHAVVRGVGPSWLGRVSLAEPLRLATVRLPGDGIYRHRLGDALPEVLQERCEELVTALPSAQRALGRRSQAERLAQRMLQRPLRLLLLGDRGVGKSTLVADAVTRLRTAGTSLGQRKSIELPELPRVLRTSAQRLIAGARWLGEWEEQVQEVVEAVQSIGAILVVANLADLLTTGGEEPGSGVGAFLAGPIDRGELPVVVEATAEELAACRRLLPRLAAALQVEEIYDLSDSVLTEVLAEVVVSGPQQGRPEVEPGATEAALDLFSRFLPYRPRVQVVPFVRDAYGAAAKGGGRLGTELVVDRFCAKTGLPAVLVDDRQALTRERLIAALGERVLGQDGAVARVADELLLAKAGLCDPGRPMSVLLFCGPTGVGKTELCRALGDFLFANRPEEDRVLRLDMSEYGLPGAAHRFVRAGDQPAVWLQRLRRDPFAVVLFDEIEKADPAIFDLLLSVFDEGRLVDAFGRQTNLRSTMLVMTSNLGVKAGEGLGFGDGPGVDYAAAVARFFRPEFGNRIGAIVPFAPLSAEAVLRITEKELRAIERRDGMTRRALRLAWDPPVVEHLARIGMDAQLGARPLQRTIEQSVMTQISELLTTDTALRDATLRLVLEAKDSVRVVVERG